MPCCARPLNKVQYSRGGYQKGLGESLRALPAAEANMIDLPYRFPSEADKIYREAQEFRRLSSTERFQRILDLIAFEAAMLRESPHREAIERLRQEEKAEWRRLQKEFLARHAPSTPGDSTESQGPAIDPVPDHILQQSEDC